MSSILNKIKTAKDIQRKEIHVPEWDVTLYVQKWSSGELDRLVAKIDEIGDKKVTAVHAWVVVYGVVDENGRRVFTDADFPIVAAKSLEVVARLSGEVKAYNRAGENLDDEKKDSAPTTG